MIISATFLYAVSGLYTLSLYKNIIISASKTLRTGNFTSDEIERYLEANNVLEKLPIYLDDTPAITVNQIKAKCRKLYNESMLDIIFVDYLQIMGYAKNLQNREQQISEISRSLKGMAKEFNVPVWFTGISLSK